MVPPQARHVLTTVERTLTEAGFTVAKEQFSLARNNNRFFGVLDLARPSR